MNGLDYPGHRAWAGYAFEEVCLAHIREICQALGIAGIQTSSSSWVSKDAQTDLVIDRMVNLSEVLPSPEIEPECSTYRRII